MEVQWLPFFLHPEIPPGGARLNPAMRRYMEPMHRRLQQRAEEEGMEMVTPEIVAYSRLALEATEYARDQGKADAFHRVVFRKYYGEGQNIGDWQVLRDAAEEVGLDPDEMQREVQSGAYREILDQHIADAHALGITGVPTYIIDDRYAIVGAQPYEVFQQALKELTP